MWKSLKKTGWRIAGTYFWLKIIAFIFGLGMQVITLEKDFIYLLASLLSSVGATPVNYEYLPIVIKIGWILFVTEFKPVNIVGFIFYIAVFPISFIFYLLFKFLGFLKQDSINDKKEDSSKNVKKKRTKRFFQIPVLFISGFLLLSWFLVFGNAQSKLVTTVGAIISFSFFFILTSKNFLKATPQINDQPTIFSRLESFAKLLTDTEKETDISNSSVKTAISNLKFRKSLVHKILKFLKSVNIQSYISFLILCEFAFVLIMITLSAVTFWALVIKNINPSLLDLFTCFYASFSFFLPNIQFPSLNVDIPVWIRIGNSLTAWLLWAVYVALAVNLVLEKSKSYYNHLGITKLLYRKTILNLRNQLKLLNKDQTTLLENSNVKKIEELEQK